LLEDDCERDDWRESLRAQLSRLRAIQAAGGALALPVFGHVGRAAELTTLKVAITTIEPSAEPFYAQANGFAEEAGLNLDVSTFSTSPVVLQSLLSGDYDVGGVTVTTVVAAHSQGIPLVMIAGAGLGHRSYVQGGIVVPLNSKIKGPRDLEGKVFAVPGIGTPAEYYPRSWVDMIGGDSSTIKFIEIPPIAIGDAIAAGRADAGYLNEPFYTIARNKGQVKLLSAGDEALPPEYLATAWCATPAWAKAHPESVAAFARAMYQAGAWGQANPTKVIPILESKMKLDPATLALVRRATFSDNLVVAQIQPWIDMVAKYKKFRVFPASDIMFHP
jgi:NitT/TauT family transport system substrate-binding protein